MIDYNNNRHVAVLHIARSYLILNNHKNDNERKDLGVIRQRVMEWNVDQVRPRLTDSEFEEVWNIAIEKYGYQ